MRQRLLRLAAACSRPAVLRRCSVLLLFLTIAASRLACLAFFGSDLPYSDQWDSEGWNWLRPFQNGTLDWNTLWLPHNEHRIAFVRLETLALFLLNDRQWDNLVAATANALCVAAAATWMLQVAWRRLGAPLWPLFAFTLAALCGPCGYENTLIGFQAQFYFLVFLAIWGTWLAASREPGPWLWIGFGAIACASLWTMASGLLTPACIALALLLRQRAGRTSWLRVGPALAIMALAIAWGATLIVRVPGHDGLHAQSFGQWWDALTLVAGWPLPPSTLSVAVLWSPLLLGAVDVLRRRERDPVPIAAVALGAWTALQAASIAWGRANDMHEVHSRYADVLAPGLLANVYFCIALARRARVRAAIAVTLASIWLTAASGGYAARVVISAAVLVRVGETSHLQLANVRAYLHGDAAAIDAAESWNIPYPDKRRLEMMLADPTIRDILPAGARPPLVASSFAGLTANGFAPGTAPPPVKSAYGTFDPRTGKAATVKSIGPPVRTRFPWLRFSVAGDFGADAGLAFATGDHTIAVAAPAPAAGAWRTLNVAPPAGDFRVVAFDDSRERWFAFTPLVEVGRLSAWTQRLLDGSPYLLLACLSAVYFLAQYRWFQRREPLPSSVSELADASS
jgi:hypothetical protein